MKVLTILKELLAKASNGTWIAIPDKPNWRINAKFIDTLFMPRERYVAFVAADSHTDETAKNNALLIVTAVNELPELIANFERLLAQLEATKVEVAHRSDVCLGLQRENELLTADNAKAMEVIKALLEPQDSPCRKDHHGLCQEHHLRRNVKGDPECEVEMAREYLALHLGYPVLHCPQCGEGQIDLDGFGVIHCSKCKHCLHPNVLTNGKCAICGTDCRK